jgi:hypothetical protein
MADINHGREGDSSAGASRAPRQATPPKGRPRSALQDLVATLNAKHGVTLTPAGGVVGNVAREGLTSASASDGPVGEDRRLDDPCTDAAASGRVIQPEEAVARDANALAEGEDRGPVTRPTVSAETEPVATATTTDTTVLAGLDHKLQVMRDRVRGVVERYTTGLYLWGEGGTSKSFTIEGALKDLGAAYKLSNTRVTGKSLYNLLADHPDVVHVVEDAEVMFKSEATFGVLRSALWGPTGAGGEQVRTVCWQTAKGRHEFVFTGGIILVANRDLGDIPEARALKTRLLCLHHQLTDDEIAAQMRAIARKGYARGSSSLSPEACLEVADAIVERTATSGRKLDLRLMVNALNDRLQFVDGASDTHWLELLDSRLEERVVVPAGGVGVRARRKNREYEVLRQTTGLSTQDRLAVWMKETGRSRAALYRRLDELEQAESQISQFSPG